MLRITAMMTVLCCLVSTATAQQSDEAIDLFCRALAAVEADTSQPLYVAGSIQLSALVEAHPETEPIMAEIFNDPQDGPQRVLALIGADTPPCPQFVRLSTLIAMAAMLAADDLFAPVDDLSALCLTARYVTTNVAPESRLRAFFQIGERVVIDRTLVQFGPEDTVSDFYGQLQTRSADWSCSAIASQFNIYNSRNPEQP